MKISVPEETEPIRIDQFLTMKMPEKSRASWQKAITIGKVKVDGKSVSKHYKIKAGEIVQISEIEKKDSESILPDIQTIEETDDYIVIDKPSGVLSHGNNNNNNPSVVDWALSYSKSIKEVGDDPSNRPGIVHRLDKNASGLMVIAKTNAFFDHLKSQFQTREVEKEYKALVHGTNIEDEGMISFRIKRTKRSGKMAAVPIEGEEGKEAITEFKVLERYTSSTLLLVQPKTGRTHQIRVHFFATEHPIVGDTLYKSKHFSDKLDKKLDRLFLHANSISFTDLENKKHTYKAPLPQILKQFLNTIKKK